ncbi:hypothetical protein GTPT_0127 [Tatumella ptyseos ATCC 33301]|uniref:Lipoprotein n=2 Tax=Tatumella ptyseos TaxID=82987 RepID=A0A085JQ06_9GAMM|nr:hypothetical protein GTPT_0127 [Tatumella ptyseos ATCC 33301]SQK72167.1 Uncharacterised protein [Tatumella ptyseos]
MRFKKINLPFFYFSHYLLGSCNFFNNFFIESKYYCYFLLENW